MRRILAAALLLTSACAGKLYPVPTGDLGGHAKVAVRNLGTQPVMVWLYDDAFTCEGMAFLELPASPLQRGDEKAFYARKGEVSTVSARYHAVGGGLISRCTFNASFVPAAASYTLNFEGDAEQCRLTVVEGTDLKGNILTGGRVALRKEVTAIMGAGPNCEPLTPEQLAGLGVKAPPPKPKKAAAE